MVPSQSSKLSDSIPTSNLLSLLQSLLPTQLNPGNYEEPEPFTGHKPKKLKTFLFQCQLYFRSSSKFQDDSKWVTSALSYLQDITQEWFEAGVPGLSDKPPLWLDNWNTFVKELRTNLRPFNEVGISECELVELTIDNNEHASKYTIHFTSLAFCCNWDESTLLFRYYEGLPAERKDTIITVGKPNWFIDLQSKVHSFDAHYWECEHEREHSLESNHMDSFSFNISTPSPSVLTPSVTPEPEDSDTLELPTIRWSSPPPEINYWMNSWF